MMKQVVESWNEVLERIDPLRRDLYFTEEYVKLYASEGVEARCFIREEHDSLYLLPYLVHPNLYLDGRNDMATPYGYGGPISNSDDPGFIARSNEAFCSAMAQDGAISGFVRCHPLLVTQSRLDERWDVRFDRGTVGVDLSGGPDDLWTGQLSRKARNRVRRADAAGVELIVCEDLCLMEQFKSLYYHAMDVVKAAPFYYFTQEYFDAIRSGLGGRCVIMFASLNGEIIAGMMLLMDHLHAHAHLSGSRVEHRDVAPNDFVAYHAMLYAQQHGCKRFHFGGGATSRPDDTLLRFKRSFSPDSFDFYTARTIFDRAAYDEAMRLWASEAVDDALQNGRFPAYGLYVPAA